MTFLSFDSITLINYATIASTVILPSLGVALGQAKASKNLMQAIDQQPSARYPLNRLFLVGLALTETAAILSTVTSTMLLVSSKTTLVTMYAQIGASIAIALPAFFAGYLSALPITQALLSLARQPFLAQKLFNLLLLSLAIMQTPVLFGLIVSWIIQQQIPSIAAVATSIQLLAAGLALAIGCVGPLIGLALFSKQACESAGKNPQAYPFILSFTFLSQALIETPILFSLVVALLLCFSGTSLNSSAMSSVAYMVAALTIGFSTLAAGISSGYTAQTACQEIGKNAHHYMTISRTSIIAQTLIDTTPIYGFVVALLIIFSLS